MRNKVPTKKTIQDLYDQLWQPFLSPEEETKIFRRLQRAAIKRGARKHTQVYFMPEFRSAEVWYDTPGNSGDFWQIQIGPWQPGEFYETRRACLIQYYYQKGLNPVYDH